MSITTQQANALTSAGGNVVSTGGTKIGNIGQIYLDYATDQPSWVTVKTGLFGTSESFVPLAAATVEGDDISVDYDKDTIKDAPRVEPDGNLSPQEENRLYEHYGLSAPTADHTDTSQDAGVVGHDTSGPTTDDAMTVSEEKLRVGTTQQETGRARLRKYVVTENVTTTVPVSHEEVRIEREPITDANRGAAHDGPAISEEEHEVVLHSEVPVVAKDVEAVERVRLNTETISEEATVTDEVRKERVELDDDTTK